MSDILVIGYGNPDRQDDGVAWNVVKSLARILGMAESEESDEAVIYHGSTVDLMVQLQLTPEIAEVVSAYQSVCFVDAHTGAIKNDLNIVAISAIYQTSPFTHHMTPQTCLSIAENIFQHSPSNAILISIRGYSFGFSRDLSEKTQALADQALSEIVEWIKQPGSYKSHILDK